ncbi:hypothetical protein Clacol_000220 [Clathrus columnatus]|uniref:NmrA-like domain-containing protein n=1 Tax=Clathrus columnatus TaxID=1419009 RepID=A0AAV4ZY25_9AGAM|nr:hypothetical protein Clacol_000220 [Clathrus columnatus]
MSSKSTVLVIGSSGNTGFPVTLALLESGHFNVILLCRNGSQEKPRIKELRQKGAELRLGDISEDSIETLEKHLLGIDILLIMVPSALLETQKNILLAAAKSRDLKRVVPSEFAIQLEIRALVKDLKLPYTYINVGWWMDLILPYPSSDEGVWAQRSRTFVGTGEIKTAIISRTEIGLFVARILADPRTINSQVFCCGDEVSLNDIYDIGEKILMEDLRSKRNIISEEQFWDRLQEAQDNFHQSPSKHKAGIYIALAASYIMFVKGQNTLEMAKKLGYLDAKELYPDLRPLNLEEFAKKFYNKEIPELVYEESQEKSRITELKSKGAIIRVGDLAHDSVEALEKALSGIDILLSMVDGTATNFQKKIFQAALKNKDIKRVIPSEFGIFSPPGVTVTTMRDNQMEVRSYIQEIGLPYTYISVGWWMDLILPYPCSADENNMLTQRSRITVGSGKLKTAVTSNGDIGKFISRIIRDPRTLNTHVFCYGDEVTLEEVYNTAEKVSKKRTYVPKAFIYLTSNSGPDFKKREKTIDILQVESLLASKPAMNASMRCILGA